VRDNLAHLFVSHAFPRIPRTTLWTCLLPSTWRSLVPLQRQHFPNRLPLPGFLPLPLHHGHALNGQK
jgi:hypothetical protein